MRKEGRSKMRLDPLGVTAELAQMGPCTCTESGGPVADPSPGASALWLCRGEAAEARYPPNSWLWEW